MNLSDFDYFLPESSIAQTPVEPRDASRLMVLGRQSGSIAHHVFHELPSLLNEGDLLVLNDTRVIPARLKVTKADTGGQVELLLLRKRDDTHWQALVGGRGVRVGTQLSITDSVTASVIAELGGAERVIAFSGPVEGILRERGQMPLPPYIRDDGSTDPERYQTIYGRSEGSAAAPTAGLHFTPELFDALRSRSIEFAFCTLNIGPGTFQPVKSENIREHQMHHEFAQLSSEAAAQINTAKQAGRRIIAVGTTAARTLESAAILSEGGEFAHPERSVSPGTWRPVLPFAGDTNLFIYPGYRWRLVDGLITNFHLPRSTLLMMISSFAGREQVLAAYAAARDLGYRFFSFGDAMLII